MGDRCDSVEDSSEALFQKLSNVTDIPEAKLRSTLTVGYLLRMVIDGGGTQKILSDMIALGGKPVTEESLLSLFPRTVPISEAPSSTENGVESELHQFISQNAQLVHINLLQQIYLISDRLKGDVLSLHGLETHGLKDGADVVLGPRSINQFSNGYLGSSMHLVKMAFFQQDGVSGIPHPGRELSNEVLQTGVATRIDETDFYLFGQFSTEKGYVARGGRSRESNFLRISFGDQTQLSSFLRRIRDEKITTKSLLIETVRASLGGYDKIQQRKNRLNPDALLEELREMGYDLEIPYPRVFNENELRTINYINTKNKESD